MTASGNPSSKPHAARVAKANPKAKRNSGKADYKKELDELAASAKRARGVEDAIVKSYEDGEDAEIHVDIDSESTVHMHRYGDGTWWWQRGYGYEMEDEDITGKPFKEALKDALVVDNPRKKKKKSPLKKRVKKAEKKVVRGAKKAGRKVKKFAKTKTGYTAGAAGIGALALGPLGAIAGAIGGSALYDNPEDGSYSWDSLEGYMERVWGYSDRDLKSEFKEYSDMISNSKRPNRDFGTEGYQMLLGRLTILRDQMSRRGFLVMNPPKKKAAKHKTTRRRKNPDEISSIVDWAHWTGGKEGGKLFDSKREKLAEMANFQSTGVFSDGTPANYRKAKAVIMAQENPRKATKRKATKKKPVRRRKNPDYDGLESTPEQEIILQEAIARYPAAAPRDLLVLLLSYERHWGEPAASIEVAASRAGYSEGRSGGSIRYMQNIGADLYNVMENEYIAGLLHSGRREEARKMMEKRSRRTSNPPKRKTTKRKATKKKPVRRRKNPSAVDHERVGMDALKQSEKYHRRYMEHNRLNDLLDTYKWLLIGHEELKYSGKSEPRIQARDGLKAVRRLLLERM